MRMLRLLTCLAVAACHPGGAQPAQPGGGGGGGGQDGDSEYVADDTNTEGSTTIDAKDLTEAADQIVRGVLGQPKVSARQEAPRLVIDTDGWKNESSAVMNMNMLADDIRVNIVDKAQGRVRIVNREALQQVEKERELKRDGTVGAGTLAPTQATMGADYKLELRLTSHDGTNKKSGRVDRMFLMDFELVDLETAEVVWGKPFTVHKRGQDNEVYR